MMVYFTMDELCASETAKRLQIDNKPPREVVKNLERLVERVLDPARLWLGKPIIVTSGYRCEVLNNAVGGVANSHHCLGMAADIKAANVVTTRQLFNLIRDYLDYDQLIWEQGGRWIHVSYVNRRQVIT